MRRTLALTLTLAAALLVLVLPRAAAGGPTSVLVVNQADGRGAALNYQSTAYDELLTSLGGGGTPVASTPPAGVADDPATVRLVWLIHDVTPWRIDQVHVVGGAVWVETYLTDGDADPYASQAVWHRPARGAGLLAGLTALEVLGDQPAGKATPALASEAAVTAPGTSWWLTGVLVLAGVALGVIADRRLAPRLTTRRPVLAG